jgi:hypothetical protein
MYYPAMNGCGHRFHALPNAQLALETIFEIHQSNKW